MVGESSPIYKDKNPTPNFQLHDLEPGYDYTVYVYAVNGRGMSEPALLEHVRVIEPIGGKMERSGIFLEDLKKALPQASSENMIIAIALTGTGKIDAAGFLVSLNALTSPNHLASHGLNKFTNKAKSKRESIFFTRSKFL